MVSLFILYKLYSLKKIFQPLLIDFRIKFIQFNSNKNVVGADEGTRTPTSLTLVPKNCVRNISY